SRDFEQFRLGFALEVRRNHPLDPFVLLHRFLAVQQHIAESDPVLAVSRFVTSSCTVKMLHESARERPDRDAEQEYECDLRIFRARNQWNLERPHLDAPRHPARVLAPQWDRQYQRLCHETDALLRRDIDLLPTARTQPFVVRDQRAGRRVNRRMKIRLRHAHPYWRAILIAIKNQPAPPPPHYQVARRLVRL